MERGGKISENGARTETHAFARSVLWSKSCCITVFPFFRKFISIYSYSDPPGKHRVFESLPGSYERYEPDLAPKVPTGIRPDLVVGLANNPKSSKLLGAPSKDDPEKKVGEVLKSDIFANMGNPANMNEGSGMIFPFLVLEAKRASAPDSLESIARQMALPAYEMLRMQSCLLADSTASQIGGRLPRVWLVSFKGQCWRLYVATVEQEKNGEYVYNIYDMWDGDITRTSNALKLVLLLDGIFDWALDIYRLDIFKRLESMVSRGAGISSTRTTPTVSCLSDKLEKMTIAPTPNSNLGNLDTVPEDTLDVLEYKGGWVRDARRLLISGEGLLLTSRNIAEIFDNFEHPDHAKRFARLVWTLLSRNAWVFRDKYIFDRIREVWTGETRKKQQISEVPIFMQLEVYDFFDIYWRLRRGLIFVAATKDSIPELFNRAGYLKRHQDEIETMQQEISQQEFLSKLRTERQRNTVSSLGDALARWHRRLSRYPNGNAVRDAINQRAKLISQSQLVAELAHPIPVGLHPRNATILAIPCIFEFGSNMLGDTGSEFIMKRAQYTPQKYSQEVSSNSSLTTRAKSQRSMSNASVKELGLRILTGR
ncbi:hypothetical protein BDW71DRAFT_205268 [Aspergillus fruticulosus]